MPKPHLRLPARRVFISYSHGDAEDARRFHDHFSLLVQAPELALSAEHVFFDQARLLAGEQWDSSIQAELQRADFLIFLVSRHSLNSTYCMRHEVAVAARRGIPILPILLNPCSWEHIAIPDDPEGRTLGQLGALPKDERFGLKPVSDRAWTNRDHAWNRVMEGLRARLKAPSAAKSARSGTLHAHLPYFCDQDPIAGRFDLALGKWDGHALVVLVKGIYEDNPAGFWTRLHRRNLRERVECRRQTCLDVAPLAWPEAEPFLAARDELAYRVRCEVSRALTGNGFLIDTPEALGPVLAELAGVRPLVAALPRESAKATRASVEALLEFLDGAGSADLSRLVVALVLENDNLLDKNLTRLWKLQGYRRSHVVELTKLNPIDRQHVREWHRMQSIAEKFRVSETELLDHVFSAAPVPLRLRQFDDIVTPLLGLNREHP
jgi:hypothetical protein